MAVTGRHPALTGYTRGIVHPPGYIPDDQIFPRWERVLRVLWWTLPALVAGFGFYTWNKTRDRTPVVVKLPAPQQVTRETGFAVTPAVSADGKWLAYASDRDTPGILSIWVAPLGSGPARRITPPEHDAIRPDFSPDGNLIAYRSSRDGGVYVTPVAGGSPRLIVKNGWRPRFSPDGKWIACYEVVAPGRSRLLLAPVTGGEPRQLRTDFRSALLPVWVSSTHLIFEGANGEGMADWWATPIDDGPVSRLHAFAALQKPVPFRGAPERWRDGYLLFTGSPAQHLHVWELPVSPVTWEITGPPRQLTDGSGAEAAPALAGDGSLYYNAIDSTLDAWSVEGETNTARLSGPPKRLTSGEGRVRVPEVSADGSRLVFIANRSGSDELRWKDLNTGKETVIAQQLPRIAHRPVLAPSGDRVAIPASEGARCAIQVLGMSGAVTQSIASPCAGVWDWSPNGRDFLILDPRNPFKSIDVLTADGQRPLLRHSERKLFGARYSPDGRWVAFTAGGNITEAELFIAPVRSGAVVESEWIQIPMGRGGVPAWSPNGGMIYAQSIRDGSVCLWAQPLNAAKRPVGEPIAVQHFHNGTVTIAPLGPTEFHLSVAKNRIVWNASSNRGNIWRTSIR